MEVLQLHEQFASLARSFLHPLPSAASFVIAIRFPHHLTTLTPSTRTTSTSRFTTTPFSVFERKDVAHIERRVEGPPSKRSVGGDGGQGEGPPLGLLVLGCVFVITASTSASVTTCPNTTPSTTMLSSSSAHFCPCCCGLGESIFVDSLFGSRLVGAFAQDHHGVIAKSG